MICRTIRLKIVDNMRTEAADLHLDRLRIARRVTRYT